LRADPGDGFPIVWFRGQHGRDAAEAGKKSAPTELWPKRSADDSKVHSANGLAFDDGPTRQVVITDTKPFDAEVRSTFPQEMRHAALPFMDIGNDQHGVTRLPTRLCLDCRISVAVRPLALSQGESA